MAKIGNFSIPAEVGLQIPQSAASMDGYRRLRQGESRHEIFYCIERNSDGSPKLLGDQHIVLVQLWWNHPSAKWIVQRNYLITSERLNGEYAEGVPNGK